MRFSRLWTELGCFMDKGISGLFARGEQVFRFYPDGTVLDVWIKPAPTAAGTICDWLRRDAPPAGVNILWYESIGEVVQFSSPGHLRDGRLVHYRGRLRDHVLHMDIDDEARGTKERARAYRRLT